MQQHTREEEREARIASAILVDCHGEQEHADAWYTYLADTLAFPFTALCRTKRAISPLLIGYEVDVIGMGPAECAHEIFVFMRWERDGLAVPLAQLDVTDVDEATRQAREDWLYWVDRGYHF
jgi:hypothetical protein